MTTQPNAPGAEGAGLGGGAAPNGSDAASTPWYSTIEDESLRGWVEQAGYKDPVSLAKSHKDLMAFRGVPPERLAQIPENWDNAEQVNAFYERVGRPKTPAEYGIVPPEGYDADFFNNATQWLHEEGLTKRQAQGLVAKWSKYGEARMAADAQAEADQAAADIAKLRSEWGANYPALEEQGRRAFRKFGGDDAEMARLEASMGTAAFLKLFQRIGEQMGESQFVEGDPSPGSGGFGVLSPQGARARKESLMGDKAFVDRYFRGEPAAVNEITRLQQMEAAGMETPVSTVVPAGGAVPRK